VSIVLCNKIQIDLLEGGLFLIPIALHAALSTASLGQVHGEVRESRWAKITLSLSSFIGVIFANLIPIPNILNNIFVSIIAGILLYIIVKEFLHEKEKGQPVFFFLGVLLFIGFYIILEYILLD